MAPPDDIFNFHLRDKFAFCYKSKFHEYSLAPPGVKQKRRLRGEHIYLDFGLRILPLTYITVVCPTAHFITRMKYRYIIYLFSFEIREAVSREDFSQDRMSVDGPNIYWLYIYISLVTTYTRHTKRRISVSLIMAFYFMPLIYDMKRKMPRATLLKHKNVTLNSFKNIDYIGFTELNFVGHAWLVCFQRVFTYYFRLYFLRRMCYLRISCRFIIYDIKYLA